jgi:hypothetical protein
MPTFGVGLSFKQLVELETWLHVVPQMNRCQPAYMCDQVAKQFGSGCKC